MGNDRRAWAVGSERSHDLSGVGDIGTLGGGTSYKGCGSDGSGRELHCDGVNDIVLVLNV